MLAPKYYHLRQTMLERREAHGGGGGVLGALEPPHPPPTQVPGVHFFYLSGTQNKVK